MMRFGTGPVLLKVGGDGVKSLAESIFDRVNLVVQNVDFDIHQIEPIFRRVLRSSHQTISS